MNIVKTHSEISGIPKSQRHLWYIPEHLSTAMAIEESGEGFVELHDAMEQYGIRLLFGAIPSEYGGLLHLRKGAAERLLNAASRLHARTSGAYSIKLTDAFRPLAVQRAQFEKIRAEIAAREGLDGRVLWERVTQFIADPDLCPPHSTGGTIDCTIARLFDGRELDMGTPVDTSSDLANTWNPEISDSARANRKLLFDVLTAEGFVNLASEWWHYSYGDQYWAAFNVLPHAIYGSIQSLP